MRLRLLALPLTLCVFTLAASCGEPGLARTSDDPSDSGEVRRNDALPAADTLHLQENAAVINVEPVVEIDREGGFVVADLVESQVRLYSRGGTLLRHFGTKGNGPREFNGVSVALRLPSNEVAAFETDGKIAIFGPDGDLHSTQKTPLIPIYDAAVITPDTLAVVGRLEGRSNTPLIHLWSLREQRILHSFFEVPPHPKNLAPAYSFSGFADIAVRNECAGPPSPSCLKLAAVFALADSVYVFDGLGEKKAAVRIPAAGFRPLLHPMPANGSPVDEQRWMQSFSTYADVFWTSTGDLIAQYFDVVKAETRWSFVVFDQDGRKKLEHHGSQLLAVSPQDSLFFIAPHSLEKNQWSVGLLPR